MAFREQVALLQCDRHGGPVLGRFAYDDLAGVCVLVRIMYAHARAFDVEPYALVFVHLCMYVCVYLCIRAIVCLYVCTCIFVCRFLCLPYYSFARVYCVCILL